MHFITSEAWLDLARTLYWTHQCSPARSQMWKINQSSGKGAWAQEQDGPRPHADSNKRARIYRRRRQSHGPARYWERQVWIDFHYLRDYERCQLQCVSACLSYWNQAIFASFSDCRSDWGTEWYGEFDALPKRVFGDGKRKSDKSTLFVAWRLFTLWLAPGNSSW